MRFSACTYFLRKTLCFRNTKRIVDLFCKNYVFCHYLMTTDIQFMWYLLPNNYSKGIDSQKIVIYRTKKSNKTLYIMSWNALGAFVQIFLVPTQSFTLVVNTLNHWNNHWTFFRETSFSNRLSTLNFIWNFPFRPERKFFLRRENFGSQFSF